eukprot:364700-Chlamydomonas_euryale.AAC.5
MHACMNAGRQAGTNAGRHASRHACWTAWWQARMQAGMQAGTHAGMHGNRHAGRQACKQARMLACMVAGRHAGRRAGRQAGTHAGRQACRQAGMCTCTLVLVTWIRRGHTVYDCNACVLALIGALQRASRGLCRGVTRNHVPTQHTWRVRVARWDSLPCSAARMSDSRCCSAAASLPGFIGRSSAWACSLGHSAPPAVACQAGSGFRWSASLHVSPTAWRSMERASHAACACCAACGWPALRPSACSGTCMAGASHDMQLSAALPPSDTWAGHAGGGGMRGSRGAASHGVLWPGLARRPEHPRHVARRAATRHWRHPKPGSAALGVIPLNAALFGVAKASRRRERPARGPPRHKRCAAAPAGEARRKCPAAARAVREWPGGVSGFKARLRQREETLPLTVAVPGRQPFRRAAPSRPRGAAPAARIRAPLRGSGGRAAPAAAEGAVGSRAGRWTAFQFHVGAGGCWRLHADPPGDGQTCQSNPPAAPHTDRSEQPQAAWRRGGVAGISDGPVGGACKQLARNDAEELQSHETIQGPCAVVASKATAKTLICRASTKRITHAQLTHATPFTFICHNSNDGSNSVLQQWALAPTKRACSSFMDVQTNACRQHNQGYGAVAVCSFFLLLFSSMALEGR